MSDTFTPIDKVDFKDVKYLKIHADGPAEEHPYEFTLRLPEPLASWDVFAYWEKERTRSMRDNLKQGDTLFDIGAENGWQSVVYSKFVGAENMVLMEPTREFWPNILATWKANGLANPKACWRGLVGNQTKNVSVPSDLNQRLDLSQWPQCAHDGKLINKKKFVYIHESGDVEPQITIDDFVRFTGIVPDALTADCEGAEILIINGAQETLRKYHPKVWLSLHDDLALRDYNSPIQEVHDLMHLLGYEGICLATDHETHMYYEATARSTV
jgi:FkbM family methyltransferase